jgi:RNA polymerase sigma-70 factor (ECF subfamily)
VVVDVDSMFPALVRDHQDRIFSTAWRLTGNRSEAEDAAQDTFVQAYRALSDWPPKRLAELKPGPWLATIVLNVCRNRARSRSRRPVTVPLDRDHVAPDQAGSEWGHLVDGLPPRYRTPILLRHVAGLSCEEVAEVLALPVGTVKAQISRGLTRLREHTENGTEKANG